MVSNWVQEYVTISALQHYAFCPRQCAYIHIERQWTDNYLTARGNQLHERVHSNEVETRRGRRTERGVQVHSEKLGITGKLDLLEIQQNPLALTPVEYKRGKPKIHDCDRIQLCAQALCLEEMRNVRIDKAALWYWQVRRREWVELSEQLRLVTLTTINDTRKLLAECRLPPAVYTKSCKACSFFDLCEPKRRDSSAHYAKRLFDL